jgi:hypothetical protein
MNTTTVKKAESIELLKRILSDGDIVYCILRSRSKSGMSRRIDFYAFKNGSKYFFTNPIAELCGLGYGIEAWRQSKGARVNGCGMDMGFAVINDLSHVLGIKLQHEWL